MKRVVWRIVQTLLAVVVVAAITGGGLWYRAHHRRAVATTQPATAPSTQASVPTTVASERPAVAVAPRTFLELVKLTNPQVAATQPLESPLPLREAAHVRVEGPLYICSAQNLWIRRSDAEPTAAVLAKATDAKSPQRIHLVNENILYVHWMSDDAGSFVPQLLVLGGSGKMEFVTRNGRRPIAFGHAYHWDRAFWWDERAVVPSDTGIAVIQFSPEVVEHYHDLAGATSAPATGPATAPSEDAPRPVAIPGPQGLLAWIPWENGKAGGKGVARYVEDKWSDLSGDGWPAKMTHLVVLRDGSLLQMVVGDDGASKLAMIPMDAPAVDEAKIQKLVETLSNDEEAKRKAAYDELWQYGPGLWPVLDKLKDAQPPEAQGRIEQLLANKIQPTLGGMSLVDGQLRVVDRQPDGGALFYAENGVTIPHGEEEASTVAPAYLAVRPGRRVTLLSEVLTARAVADLPPERFHLTCRSDEWLVTDEVLGWRRYLGKEFVPLLRKSEQEYSQFVGIATGNRWIFRKPGTDAYLVLDPTLPDSTPRMPVWTIVVNNGSVGWDQENWPAMKKGSAFSLRESSDWYAHEEGKDKYSTDPAEIPSPSSPSSPPTTAASSTTAATTGPSVAAATTSPATQPLATTFPSETPLLIDSEGTHYYGGQADLRMITASGKSTVWTLPELLSGTGEAHLIRTADGRLYLFNIPGRVVRLRPTADPAAPFEMEAIFTRRIPSVEHPTRIWLDPAGRICIVFDTNHLSILFPSGRIPPQTAALIPASEEMPEGDE